MALSATLQVQRHGKGKFEPARVELDLNVLRVGIAVGSTLRLTVRAPKSKRKGQPHAFRVDLGEKDRTGVAKYVFGASSADEMQQWTVALQKSAEPLETGEAGEGIVAEGAAQPVQASTITAGMKVRMAGKAKNWTVIKVLDGRAHIQMDGSTMKKWAEFDQLSELIDGEAAIRAPSGGGGRRLPNDQPPNLKLPKAKVFPPLFAACLLEPAHTARRQFEHRSAGGSNAWELYTDAQNVTIARAVRQQDQNGMVELPGLQVEVRFGEAAVGGGRIPAVPASSMIQVNKATGVARAVRPVKVANAIGPRACEGHAAFAT
jgi:hypothetical protein